jgi:hypothetical protein
MPTLHPLLRTLHSAALAACTGLALCGAATCAYAQASNDVGGSVAVATLSVIVAPVGSAIASSQGHNPLAGSAVALAGLYVITAVSYNGNFAELLLKSSSNASQVSVKMAKSAADAVGASVGTAVTVISETTGMALVASGKVLAFVPNALGESLLYQARVPAAQ